MTKFVQVDEAFFINPELVLWVERRRPDLAIIVLRGQSSAQSELAIMGAGNVSRLVDVLTRPTAAVATNEAIE